MSQKPGLDYSLATFYHSFISWGQNLGENFGEALVVVYRLFDVFSKWIRRHPFKTKQTPLDEMLLQASKGGIKEILTYLVNNGFSSRDAINNALHDQSLIEKFSNKQAELELTKVRRGPYHYWFWKNPLAVRLWLGHCLTSSQQDQVRRYFSIYTNQLETVNPLTGSIIVTKIFNRPFDDVEQLSNSWLSSLTSDSDINLVILGKTRVGKTTFVDKFLGNNRFGDSGIESVTEGITVSDVNHSGVAKLFDCQGFCDTRYIELITVLKILQSLTEITLDKPVMFIGITTDANNQMIGLNEIKNAPAFLSRSHILHNRRSLEFKYEAPVLNDCNSDIYFTPVNLKQVTTLELRNIVQKQIHACFDKLPKVPVKAFNMVANSPLFDKAVEDVNHLHMVKDNAKLAATLENLAKFTSYDDKFLGLFNTIKAKLIP